MAMSKAQKKLRQWFQRHGWHTANTPTGLGFYMESPVENRAGGMRRSVDPKTGEKREYCNEAYLGVELDRIFCDHLTFEIFTRKHWWKRDPSIAEDDHGGYTWVPSDDFEDWPRNGVTVNIPTEDILKLADLIRAAQAEWMEGRKGISKHCLVRWIGVNSSYTEIKWTYSNERLRKERGYAGFREKEAMENGGSV